MNLSAFKEEYAFIGLTEEEYEKIYDIAKTSQKENEKDNFDLILRATIYTAVVDKIQRKKIKELDILTNFINMNLLNEKEKCNLKVAKLQSIINHFEIEITIDDAEELLKNEILSSIIKEFVSKKDYIKLIHSEGIMTIVETYCILNDLEIAFENKDDNNHDHNILTSRGEISSYTTYIHEIPSKILTASEEMSLFKEYATSGSINIKNELIERNLRLVISIAKRYVKKGVEIEDLTSEGNIGLITAVERFDYTKGFKFSTYASWWIRQAIIRSIENDGKTIRIPVHQQEAIKKVKEFRKSYSLLMGREPTDKEIANTLNMTVTRIKDITSIDDIQPISLDTPVGTPGENENSLADFIEDTKDQSNEIDIKIMGNELREMIDEILPEREKYVIYRRYGLTDGRYYTLAEIGKELSITRERVRQLENKGIGRLKRNAKIRCLYEGKSVAEDLARYKLEHPQKTFSTEKSITFLSYTKKRF